MNLIVFLFIIREKTVEKSKAFYFNKNVYKENLVSDYDSESDKQCGQRFSSLKKMA